MLSPYYLEFTPFYVPFLMMYICNCKMKCKPSLEKCLNVQYHYPGPVKYLACCSYNAIELASQEIHYDHRSSMMYKLSGEHQPKTVNVLFAIIANCLAAVLLFNLITERVST